MPGGTAKHTLARPPTATDSRSVLASTPLRFTPQRIRSMRRSIPLCSVPAAGPTGDWRQPLARKHGGHTRSRIRRCPVTPHRQIAGCFACARRPCFAPEVSLPYAQNPAPAFPATPRAGSGHCAHGRERDPREPAPLSGAFSEARPHGLRRNPTCKGKVSPFRYTSASSALFAVCCAHKPGS